MKRRNRVALILGLAGLLSFPDFARPQPPRFTSAPQEQAGKSSDEERVYSPKEVDKRAVIKNPKEIDPGKLGPSSDCQNRAVVALKLVLRKTGKVSDVEVVKPAFCSLDDKALTSVAKIKFTPAIKDGVPVSQSLWIEFQFHGY
jgi:TonB family protein